MAPQFRKMHSITDKLESLFVITGKRNNVSKTPRETGVDRMSIKRWLYQEGKLVEVSNKRRSCLKYAFPSRLIALEKELYKWVKLIFSIHTYRPRA